MIASAWAEDKRVKLWHGPTAWSGAFRVFTGAVKDGSVAWNGGKVDDGAEVGGVPVAAWLPQGATKIIISVGRGFGQTDANVHEPGGLSPTTLPVAEKPQLTDRDVYGGVDAEEKKKQDRFDAGRKSFARKKDAAKLSSLTLPKNAAEARAYLEGVVARKGLGAIDEVLSEFRILSEGRPSVGGMGAELARHEPAELGAALTFSALRRTWSRPRPTHSSRHSRRASAPTP